MKLLKKTVYVFTAICLVIGSVFCFPASAAGTYSSKVPIIYVHGQGSPSGVRQEDGTVKMVKGTDMSFNSEIITGVISENKDIILEAIKTQDWSDFIDLVADFMTDSFGEAALGPDGYPTDGSEVMSSFDRGSIAPTFYGVNDSLNRYSFFYDWRLDPTDNMARLREYVELVLEVTGSEKYAMIGRCEGACLALTYWETYHDERMTDLIFYASAAKGAMPIGEAFSGNLHIDPDSVERYIYETDLGLNVEVNENFTLTDDVLSDILRTVSNMYGLDYACWAINNVYVQIYEEVTRKTVKPTLATFPGYWAMCEDKYYEDAKKVIFGGEEEKYAEFIKKIDNYHYNIMNRVEEIIKNAQDSGVRVSDIVKYGFQSFPVTADSNLQSDQIVKVNCAGFGAGCTKIGETFSSSYLKMTMGDGSLKYISPDLTIDAYKSVLKDSTWFIKNLLHTDFPACVDDLIFHIVNSEKPDAPNDTEYPQYLFYDKESGTLTKLASTEKKTKIDEFNEINRQDFARKMKPIFKIFYHVVVLILKIFTPRARV